MKAVDSISRWRLRRIAIQAARWAFWIGPVVVAGVVAALPALPSQNSLSTAQLTFVASLSGGNPTDIVQQDVDYDVNVSSDTQTLSFDVGTSPSRTLTSVDIFYKAGADGAVWTCQPYMAEPTGAGLTFSTNPPLRSIASYPESPRSLVDALHLSDQPSVIFARFGVPGHRISSSQAARGEWKSWELLGVICDAPMPSGFQGFRNPTIAPPDYVDLVPGYIHPDYFGTSHVNFPVGWQVDSLSRVYSTVTPGNIETKWGTDGGNATDTGGIEGDLGSVPTVVFTNPEVSAETLGWSQGGFLVLGAWLGLIGGALAGRLPPPWERGLSRREAAGSANPAKESR